MTVAATRVGVDVGGTFTDVVLHGADGRVAVRKLLSTPPRYDRAVVEAVGALAGDADVSEVIHGTTVATNAVLERRGSLTALVTTAGFRDVLELRRLRIPHMYDLFWRKPAAARPAAAPLRGERARGGGRDRPPRRSTRTSAARSPHACATTGVESVAVCLLHSYLYPEHEQRLGAILAEELPDANVSLSSEILREQREYERSATTVVNAYVRPLMASYLDRIRTGLDGIGLDGPLQIMQSSGGVMSADDAQGAAGVRARVGAGGGRRRRARDGGAARDRRTLIAFDMGGTTAKASLIEDGAIARGREYEVGGSMSAGSRLIRGAGELLRIPTIDIAEVGAGGGSIAWLDPAGGLQVGPRSAGRRPGAGLLRARRRRADGDRRQRRPRLHARGRRRRRADLDLRRARRAGRASRRRAARADAPRGGQRHPPDRERADDAGAALGLVREGPRPARLRPDRLRRRRARSTRPGSPRTSACGRCSCPRSPASSAPSASSSRGPSSTRCGRATWTWTRSIPPRSRRSSPRWRPSSRARSTGVRRSSGRGRPISATAARAGRSRSASRRHDRRGRARRAAGALRGRARAALRRQGPARARRSRSARCASPRSARRPRRAPSTSTARTRRLGRLEPPDPRRGDDLDAPVRTRSSLGEVAGAGPAARRRVRHDGRRPAGLVGPARRGHRDARAGTGRRWRLGRASTRSRCRSSATRSRRWPTRWRRRSSGPRTRRSSGTGWTSPPSSATPRARTVAQAVSVPFHLGSIPPRWRRCSSTTATGSGRATSS